MWSIHHGRDARATFRSEADLPDFVILANVRWNRDGEGRGGNSSAQYADAIMRRGWRVSFLQKDGANHLTPLAELALGPQTVVMCDMPWVDFYLELFVSLQRRGCRTVYRIVDNWLLTHRQAEYREEREIEFIRTADAVFASNPLNIERFRRVRDDITLLRNGVDLDYLRCRREKPADLRRGNPTAVFSASFWDPTWVDWEALLYAADTRPELALNILGAAAGLPKRKLPPNLHLLGRRPWSDLPAYLQHAEVGLVAYDAARTSYTNPLKVLEYLASGLPVVASPNPSLEDYPYVFFYRSPQEFVEQISAAAAVEIDREALYRTLQQHTWEARLDQLLTKLKL